MTKYEKEAKEWVEQFQAQIKEYPAEIYPDNIEYQQAKEYALILCDSHIYSENNSPFDTIGEWQQNDNHWQKVKQAIKAIEV